MTKNAKVLLAALGFVAVAAAPAMAASHHVRTQHIQTNRVLTQPVAPVAAQRLAPVVTSDRGQIPDHFQYTDGYQSDRQMVGTSAGD